MLLGKSSLTSATPTADEDIYSGGDRPSRRWLADRDYRVVGLQRLNYQHDVQSGPGYLDSTAWNIRAA